MNQKKSIFRIESLIVILIAVCMIFLQVFMTNKISELENSGIDAMFIMDDIPISNNEVFGNQILRYHPESCKMIEVYDNDFNLLFSLQFDKQEAPNRDIRNYPDLIETLLATTEGQTNFINGEFDENVYFEWLDNDNGEQRLVIVYSTKPEVHNLWVFSFISYLVIILVFILLIVLNTRSYNDKLKWYHNLTKQLRDTSDE